MSHVSGLIQVSRMFTLIAAVVACAYAEANGDWTGDLRAIRAEHWNEREARHLLDRAGFGGTPEEIGEITRLGPEHAVRRMVYAAGLPDQHLPAFEHSGVWDEGLLDFPPSRPATTQRAMASGAALGVSVKPAGNRPVQPVVNRFFYWLRASRLETNRVAYWWAQRMVASNYPLQEKLALFWHGHFATNEDKVRDYRKMLKQLKIFREQGLGDFHALLLAVAKDPAMLAFLDAGVNVKGAPNENFAREIMELFTLGVGQYSERDIREAARAFTGWNFDNLDFAFNPSQHDDGMKEFLGERGRFSGEDVIDIILRQDAAAEFLATRLYQFFVRQSVSPALTRALGDILRGSGYDISAYLQTLFLSRDFYSCASVATHIKSPVELVVSTYRKLGLTSAPGVPDFNVVTGTLGQRLMHPPTVAGWSEGRAWITPGLFFERGNFILDLMFPDISFIPLDRYPSYAGGEQILAVDRRIRGGADMTSATRPANDAIDADRMAMSNAMADRDEAFNTRYGSYRGWQMAIERVKPIVRDSARINLSEMITREKLGTCQEAVDYLARRFLSVELDVRTRVGLAEFLSEELGTADIAAASSYMEDSLRVLLHLLLSLPEYQLG